MLGQDGIRSYEEPQNPLPPVDNLKKQNTPENAELLATKWLSTKQLLDLARSEGLVYKVGKFSLEEKTTIGSAIEAYRQVISLLSLSRPAAINLISQRNSLTAEELEYLIFQKYNKARHDVFWSELGAYASQSHRKIVDFITSFCSSTASVECRLSSCTQSVSALGKTGCLGRV
jgi:hypothetical protein